MAGARALKLPRPLGEWWLYFAIGFALVFWGFWPSFFAVLQSTQLPHLIHGFSATCWMILGIVQASLIKFRKRAWHRKLGYSALVLAPIVVLSGLRVLQINTLRTDAAKIMVRREFLYIDLTGLVLFSLFLGLAIAAARRRDFPLHLRLMACTVLIPMEAAIERVLGNTMPSLFPGLEGELQGGLVFMEVVLVVLIAGELKWRQLRWPFPTLLAYYLVMHATKGWVAASPAWAAFGRWYGSL